MYLNKNFNLKLLLLQFITLISKRVPPDCPSLDQEVYMPGNCTACVYWNKPRSLSISYSQLLCEYGVCNQNIKHTMVYMYNGQLCQQRHTFDFNKRRETGYVFYNKKLLFTKLFHYNYIVLSYFTNSKIFSNSFILMQTKKYMVKK